MCGTVPEVCPGSAETEACGAVSEVFPGYCEALSGGIEPVFRPGFCETEAGHVVLSGADSECCPGSCAGENALNDHENASNGTVSAGSSVEHTCLVCHLWLVLVGYELGVWTACETPCWC